MRRMEAALLGELPAVMVTGPRAAGKTTSARRLAADVLRLDDPAVATAVAANPDAALRRASEPVLVDEWQEVPEVLGAVKRAVDDDPRPGRFLLTGSVEANLTTRMWPGTGRIVRFVLHGLTQREITGAAAPRLMETVMGGELERVGLPADVPDVDGYIDLAMRSGFPEPVLRLGPVAARRGWTRTSNMSSLVTFAPRGKSATPCGSADIWRCSDCPRRACRPARLCTRPQTSTSEQPTHTIGYWRASTCWTGCPRGRRIGCPD